MGKRSVLVTAAMLLALVTGARGAMAEMFLFSFGTGGNGGGQFDGPAVPFTITTPASWAGDCDQAAPEGCAVQGPADASTLSGVRRAPGEHVPPEEEKIAFSVRQAALEVQHLLSIDAVLSPSGLSTSVVRVSPSGEIHVYVILSEVVPERIAQLESLGLRVELVLPHFGLVQGWASPDAISRMAALDFVKEIRPPSYPTRNNVGAAGTLGDAVLRADQARATLGLTGAGVNIGVISDGTDHLANSIASGDLPAGIQVLKNPGGDEGTAMLEIVHDLAPGAGLAFYGPTTSADMVNGITALAASGARVIVDDLTFFLEPKFQDGMLAQTARSFATNGRVYVTSAGNHANRHYRAPYSRTPNTGTYAFLHNYSSGGVDIGNDFVLPSGCAATVFLQWNNVVGASADDFDLFLLRSSDGATLAQSIGTQNGSQTAAEALSFTNTSGGSVTVAIVIGEFSLASPPSSLVLDYFVRRNCGDAPPLQYVNPSDSLIGQEAVNEVLSVAAVGASTPTQIQPYSSRGPGSISFPPQVRSVPNITATDCVGTRVGALGFFAEPFCGTSAAAPHVAAIAALVIQRNPAQTSSQIHSILTGTASDLGLSGFDFTFGFGRVDALNAGNAVTIFADVPAGYFARPSIERLFIAGITGGCSTVPLLYCPESVVTREQMAVFIIRALGEFNPPSPPFQRFLDVPPSSPFYRFIDRLAQLGITGGCGGGNYCPTAPVTREQMAAFIIRALGEFSPPFPAGQRFLDVPPGNPFYAFIDRMAVLGITAGCSSTNYCPFDAVTRAQMAVFLVRAFNL
jgi:subtilisin family serine protease